MGWSGEARGPRGGVEFQIAAITATTKPNLALTTRGALEFPNLLLSVQYVVVEFQYVVVIFQFSERKFSDTPTSHTAHRTSQHTQ
jgi:hypothetical protein